MIRVQALVLILFPNHQGVTMSRAEIFLIANLRGFFLTGREKEAIHRFPLFRNARQRGIVREVVARLRATQVNRGYAG